MILYFRKYNKLISFFICVLLILTLILTSYVQSFAFPIIAPIAVEGAVLVMAVLVAFGVTADDGSMSALGEMANELYSDMPTDLRSMIDEKAMKISVGSQLFAMAYAQFSQSEWEALITWYDSVFLSNTGSFSVGVVTPDNLSAFKWTGLTTFHSTVLNAYTGSQENKIMFFDNTDYRYENRFYAYTGDFSIKFNSNNTIDLVKLTGQKITKHMWSSNYGYTSNVVNATSATGGKICMYSGTFNIVNAANNIVGTLSTGSQINYINDMLFDPNDYPLPVDINGNVNVNLPYADIGDAPDTNVAPIPTTSVDSPLSLQDVVNAYGSIDGFFDAGNAIVLADGTVIGGLSGINEYARATDIPTGATTVAEGVPELTGIKSITSSIYKILQTMSISLTNFFTPSSAVPLDFSPLKVNLLSRFPFCIPFDFANLITIFSAEPTDFQFHIVVNTSYWQIDHYVDLSPFVIPIMFFRYLAIAFFIYILISKTRSMIKW